MVAKAIKKRQAKEALLRSGYLIEGRIAGILERRNYYVSRNSVYPDPMTGKTRETDINGSIMPQCGIDDERMFSAIVLIECVNNPQPIAFVTHDPQMPFMHQYEVKIAGMPTTLPDKRDPTEWISIVDWLDVQKFHHYCAGRVATQFCSFQEKKQQGPNPEWMAFHDEHHLDCIRKLADAVDYCIEEQYRTCATTQARDQCQDIEIVYPVIVLQGDLLDVRPTRQSVTVHACEHIQFRHSEMRGRASQEYQIDVVRETFFPNYLDLVEAEVNKIDRLLRRRKREVAAAVKILSEKVKKTRKEDAKIAILKME